jgi:hypothetical protein
MSYGCKQCVAVIGKAKLVWLKWLAGWLLGCQADQTFEMVLLL